MWIHEDSTLRDSLQDGFIQAFSGSCCTTSTRRWNSSSTQSMMRMMRCGGFPSLRTVAMSAGLMVLSAASASSRAGRAASNFSSAMAWKDILYFLKIEKDHPKGHARNHFWEPVMLQFWPSVYATLRFWSQVILVSSLVPHALVTLKLNSGNHK